MVSKNWNVRERHIESAMRTPVYREDYTIPIQDDTNNDRMLVAVKKIL